MFFIRLWLSSWPYRTSYLYQCRHCGTALRIERDSYWGQLSRVLVWFFIYCLCIFLSFLAASKIEIWTGLEGHLSMPLSVFWLLFYAPLMTAIMMRSDKASVAFDDV